MLCTALIGHRSGKGGSLHTTLVLTVQKVRFTAGFEANDCIFKAFSQKMTAFSTEIGTAYRPFQSKYAEQGACFRFVRSLSRFES